MLYIKQVDWLMLYIKQVDIKQVDPLTTTGAN